MNHSKILFFFLFFPGFCNTFQAQDTILAARTTVNAIIDYDQRGLPENSVNNAIIREIAVDNVRSIKKTHLAIRSGMNIFLLKNKDAICLKASADSFELSGDHFYRKISFSRILNPSVIRFTLQLRSLQDSLIIHEFKDLSLQLKMNDSIVLPLSDGISYKASSFLQIDDASFYFNEDDLSAFHRRQRLIDDYFASAAIADSLEPAMKSMDFKKKEYYPEYFIRIEEIGKIEQLIRSRDFERELSLDLNDPGGLSMKCYYLLRFSRSSARTFESALDTIPVINSRLSEDSLIIRYMDVIKRYIRWSFLINERNSLLYHEFLDRYFELNAFEDDEKALIKLISRIYPIINADSIFREMLVKLKKAYQTEALRLTEQSRYTETIGLLDHLRRLEDKYVFLKDTLTDQGARAKAAYGIYSSYVGIAGNSINMGKNNIAKWYLDKAAEYARSNPDLLQPDSAYQDILMRYRQASLNKCDEMLAKGDFESAIACYNELGKSLDTATGSAMLDEISQHISIAREGLFHGLISDVKKYITSERTDSTMMAIDQAISLKGKIIDSISLSASIDSLKPVTDRYRYDYLIMETEQYRKKREFSTTLNKFKQAKEIAEEQHYNDQSLLDSIFRIIYPKYIEEQLAGARPLIWTNQFTRAKAFADSIEWLAGKNNFTEDPGIISALDSYRRKIHERICWNASDKINTLVIRAQRHLMGLNYIKAISLLDSAIVIDKENPGCRMATDSIKERIIKYLPAKQYQEMMIRIDGNVSLGMHDGFAVIYQEAAGYYNKNALRKFGLTLLPLFDYVEGKSKEQLTISVCKYYLDINEPGEAFRYLVLLRKQGFPVREAKGIMKSVGEEMAVKDHRSDPRQDPLVLSEKYALGDEWFTNFARSYLNEWKRLKAEDGR